MTTYVGAGVAPVFGADETSLTTVDDAAGKTDAWDNGAAATAAAAAGGGGGKGEEGVRGWELTITYFCLAAADGRPT